MDIRSKRFVERFLRTTITVSVFAFIIMVILAIIGIGNCIFWGPGLSSCLGVIISSGIYLNKLLFHLEKAKDDDFAAGVT